MPEPTCRIADFEPTCLQREPRKFVQFEACASITAEVSKLDCLELYRLE